MPLDFEATEKLHEELNALFDQRIKDRIEESVQRFLPMVDQMIKDRFDGITYSRDLSAALEARIKKDAESAADHYIRLFGGAPALREIVEKLWDKGAEKYIESEINRRLNDILRNIQLAVKDRK